MIPVVLCANDTSWDHEHDRLIPGGQGDRYLSPILAHLPEAVVSRQPQPGAVNFYMNHRNRYRPECWRGEHASVQGSHGIADKGYRDAAACASCRVGNRSAGSASPIAAPARADHAG